MCCEEKASCGCDDRSLGNDVDCDGVLLLWVSWSVFEIWESVEGGRVERSGQLLFAEVILSPQS